MSMLAYDILEYAMNDKGLQEPELILDEANREIIRKLDKNGTERSSEGMDMTLCRLDLRTRKLCVAGAKNGLLLVTPEGMKQIAVDPFSIGFSKESKYHQQEFTVPEGSCLYLFSDGFADQKGGPEGRKFMTRSFRQLIQEHASLPCPEQKQHLEQTFAGWKGREAQRDDVLVVGIRCM